MTDRQKQFRKERERERNVLGWALPGACPQVHHSHKALQRLGIESTFQKEHLWVPGVCTFISLQGGMPKANVGNKGKVRVEGIPFRDKNSTSHYMHLYGICDAENGSWKSTFFHNGLNCHFRTLRWEISHISLNHSSNFYFNNINFI